MFFFAPFRYKYILVFRDNVERNVRQRDMYQYKYYAYGSNASFFFIVCLFNTEMLVVEVRK